jgi:glycosyltransferase involved in cell wall biosynthesis
MKVAITRMGALFHYSIPKTVHRVGMLGRFYTDVWADALWAAPLKCLPKSLRPDPLKRLLERRSDALPRHLVRDFPWLALRYGWERRKARGPEQAIHAHLRAGSEFCRLIISDGLAGCNAVYASNSQGLELLAHARERGLRTFSEQTIAPLAYERALMAEEQARFPGWELPLAHAPEAVEAFASREAEEWRHCDRILCGSDFVRDAIREVGGPAKRCVVVPYGFDFPARPAKSPNRDRPLRVLTMGTVGLRKGLPYFAEAAERLCGRMEFRVVGPWDLLEPGLRRLRSVVDLVGAVPRSEVHAHFDWADVFLFPSLCEGSATVCYEALASGVPVICTHNTGSVVRDGVEGYLIPIRDVEAIVERLRCLDSDRRLLATMAEAALDRCSYFSPDAYAARLREALTADL